MPFLLGVVQHPRSRSVFSAYLDAEAARRVIRIVPVGHSKLNKAKSYSKIDGLVALSMALGSMSADEIVSATSPWDDPEFKLAV